MTNYLDIYHTLGKFNNDIAAFKTKLAETILNSGLKTRNTLINEKILKPSPLQGIFSDEHDNIYFTPSVEEKAKSEDVLFSIKVDADTSYVYNMTYRTNVDYFTYQASKITLSEYLAKKAKVEELQKAHVESGLDQYVKVISHPVTADPVFVLIDGIHNTDLDVREQYTPELIMHKNYIPASDFSGYSKIKENKSIEFIQKDNASVVVDEPVSFRGIFVDNEGSYAYMPHKHSIAPGTHCLQLTTDNNRYQCFNKNKIELSKSVSPNLTMKDMEYFKTNYSNEMSHIYKSPLKDSLNTNIILGDARPNNIHLDGSLANLVLGGAGADNFVVHYSERTSIIMDFSVDEGDRLHVPYSLYGNSQEAIDAISYKNEVAILPIGESGSLILPFLGDVKLTIDDIVVYRD